MGCPVANGPRCGYHGDLEVRMWVWLALAVAAEPVAWLTWQPDRAWLHVEAPPGEHVAPDAPAEIDVVVGERSVRLVALGQDLPGALGLGSVRGQRVSARLALSLCADVGGSCRVVEVRLAADVPGRRNGMIALEARLAGSPGPVSAPWRQDASQTWTRAVAEAGRAGRPILLDFGAVWCPPCQLLAATVLHATPRPPEVGRFVVAEIDADDPSAWALKDRYGVGGYPTLLAVDADGRELGRTVGFHDAAETLAWLGSVGVVKAEGGDETPEGAAARALEAARAGQADQARHWIAMASAAPDHEALRLARFLVAPTVEDAAWLADRAPGRAVVWVTQADAISGAPEGRDAVLRAVARDLPHASPLDAADLLAVQAPLLPEDARPGVYAAAAALVRSQLAGDPIRDKGHLGWLAYLQEHAGDVEGAVRLLTEAGGRWPEEPTFHAALGRLHLRRGAPASALAAGQAALDLAWGDNRLTAAILVAEALVALDRREEARALAAAVVAETPAPDPALQVRTRRYLDRLAAVVGP